MGVVRALYTRLTCIVPQANTCAARKVCGNTAGQLVYNMYHFNGQKVIRPVNLVSGFYPSHDINSFQHSTAGLKKVQTPGFPHLLRDYV